MTRKLTFFVILVLLALLNIIGCAGGGSPIGPSNVLGTGSDGTRQPICREVVHPAWEEITQVRDALGRLVTVIIRHPERIERVCE